MLYAVLQDIPWFARGIVLALPPLFSGLVPLGSCHGMDTPFPSLGLSVLRPLYDAGMTIIPSASTRIEGASLTVGVSGPSYTTASSTPRREAVFRIFGFAECVVVTAHKSSLDWRIWSRLEHRCCI